MEEAMMERLDVLAQQLGVATEHVWAILTRQGMIAAGLGVAGVVAGAALIAVGFYFLRRVFKTDDEDETVAFTVLAAAALLVGVVGFLTGVEYAVYAFNPEMYALERIMDLLR